MSIRIWRLASALCFLSFIGAEASAATYQALFDVHVQQQGTSSNGGLDYAPYDAHLQQTFVFDTNTFETTQLLPPLRPHTEFFTMAANAPSQIVGTLFGLQPAGYTPTWTTQTVGTSVEHVFDGLNDQAVFFGFQQAAYSDAHPREGTDPLKLGFSLSHHSQALTDAETEAKASLGWTADSFMAELRHTIGVDGYFTFRAESDMSLEGGILQGRLFDGQGTLLSITALPTTPVPEPTNAALLACGLAALIIRQQRR